MDNIDRGLKIITRTADFFKIAFYNFNFELKVKIIKF